MRWLGGLCGCVGDQLANSSRNKMPLERGCGCAQLPLHLTRRLELLVCARVVCQPWHMNTPRAGSRGIGISPEQLLACTRVCGDTLAENAAWPTPSKCGSGNHGQRATTSPHRHAITSCCQHHSHCQTTQGAGTSGQPNPVPYCCITQMHPAS